MTRRLRRGRVLVAALALCLAVLTGCVDVPVTGPVERVDGPPPPCQNCVNVEVAPPAFGDEPRQIVEGYLRATSVYQPNYAVAKQFLTAAASQTWSPEDGAQIYTGSLVSSGKSKVVLDGRIVGALGPDRAYSAQSRTRKWDFGVVQEDGQWRISTPPAGLMIAQYSFTRFYTSYNLYFIGNGATLVPDPIYLPNLPNQANVASVLMKALLTGPSKWLAPAVTSALPADVDADTVTVQNGTAVVPLNEAVLSLNDPQRRLLSAQVVYTLRQAAGIDAVRFQVNAQPFRVPESEEGSQEVPVNRISPDVGPPVPFVVGTELYAVRGRSVQVVDAAGAAPEPRPMAGRLGQGAYAVDSLGVNVANTDIAVVTDRRTVLRAGTTTSGNPATKLTGVSELLRPQYSRYGELWAVGDVGGRQRMWMFSGEQRTEVAASLLADGRVAAFRISPDGSRIALVRTVGDRRELGVARIIRGDRVTVDGWRGLDLSAGQVQPITALSDVAWLTATDLLVLGAATRQASMVPYQVSEDGSQIMAPTETNTWDAVELSVLLGAQTSVVVGRNGQTYKDDGAQWLPFLKGCTTMAFPG